MANLAHNRLDSLVIIIIIHSGVLESKIFRANAHKDVAYHWKAYTFYISKIFFSIVAPVGLPDSSRHTVHSMYPAAAAITAGILLVGRSHTGICLSLLCSTSVCKLCVLPVGK